MTEPAAGIGERFAQALAQHDVAALKAVLAPDVDFRAMTPGRFWEATDADRVVDEVVFGAWFEPDDRIRELVELETGGVDPRRRVGYRLRVDRPDGEFLVDQQAYYETDGDRISWLRVMCAGYLPATGT